MHVAAVYDRRKHSLEGEDGDGRRPTLQVTIFQREWLAEVWPVLWAGDETRPDWVVEYVIPFLGVRFAACM